MIKIENLTKTYKLDNGDEISALKDINLEIKEGEIIGIIGASGSGKTSLLRILRGVEGFNQGKIAIDDVEVGFDSSKYYSNKLKKITAIHLQRSFGLWPETALNNVIRKLYGAKYGDEASTDFTYAYDQYGKEALGLLKLVGLEDKADHFAPVLSGGEKQRLIIARQLAKKPKVLLLDEPATMACPRTKQAILDSIKNINEELGVTVVLVSHLPEVHKYLADRLVLIKDGEIKKDNTDVSMVIDDFLSEMDDEIPLDTTLTDDTMVKLRDVAKRFFLLKGGNVLNIEDISFDVNCEDILTLIGPSGAGKTILLRLIAGLDNLEEGEVLFKLTNLENSEKGGETNSWVDIYKPSIKRMEVRKKLGFMYQEFSLAHYATVSDQLAVKLGFKNQYVVDDARKRAKELELSDELLDSLYQLTDLPEIEARSRLEKIGLTPDILYELFPKFPESAVKEEIAPLFKALDLPLAILNRKSYELSGGQKVRAMLALALVSKPEILILDEPFGDLDPLTLRLVANSIKNINKEFKTTIVMVSHNINFIRELSKRAILIDEGKLIANGNTNEIVDDFLKLCNAEYCNV
ncbi:ATP-binding cassette domain-containing protein [Methanobrevibacter filiformis]|uniref:Methionine import ATP-binding protein MetN n=1 Tax=Methanobrevibacter filiformis TaxID=55758 RepID=A0A166AVG3_9EURY|nr:ATP-binding cassette domain-containing protein [Methanobrevibacter filiformis]KZX12519.1 methionine import ATP-binding protein MetN [Methanobrevibacter filiformis]